MHAFFPWVGSIVLSYSQTTVPWPTTLRTHCLEPALSMGVVLPPPKKSKIGTGMRILDVTFMSFQRATVHIQIQQHISDIKISCLGEGRLQMSEDAQKLKTNRCVN